MNLLLKIIYAPRTIAGMIADRFLWPLLLRVHGVQHGANLVLVGAPIITMKSGGTINLGENVTLYSRSTSNPLMLHTPCVLRLLTANAIISIGDNSALSGTVICAAEAVKIGARVLIGANCKITDTDFHPLSPDARRIDRNQGAIKKPIVIHDDVFIGAGALILKGTIIEEGSVVGAGSVVSGLFPPHSIIAGNPARVIKTLNIEERAS